MSRKIATIWDSKGSDNQDQGESGQAFYAGGSEHSGQQILGPSQPDRVFNDILRTGPVMNDRAASNDSILPVVLWRNGFTIGDESNLRNYDSPENRTFLESLKRGETPPEIANRVRGGIVDIKLENKAHLDYKPPSTIKPFSGVGHRLGAPTPQTLDSHDKLNETQSKK